MKIIPIIKENNCNVPSEPIPDNAIRVISDGVNYTVYEPGDILPIAPVMAPNSNDDVFAKITTLEETQTPRRMREALRDSTWINALNAQISELRKKLV